MFRIRPPVGALNPSETVSVMLTFNPGKSTPNNEKHHFSIHYIKSTDEKEAPRIAWVEYKGDPEGTKRLYVDFAEEGGKGDGEKKEENKGETMTDGANAEKKDEKKSNPH
ncbi:unnamed protein product, partial [Mesorhabditis belari]|uniref:MSP domain-containing protein n=1 Tax=Mesorhabditis belari TaxID=2138241 RepID=A0AAF3J9R5_9BILA